MLLRPRAHPPLAFSCQELGPPWTPSPLSLRGKPLGAGALASGHLPRSAPFMRETQAFCGCEDGEWPWPHPGLCTGETPQETGLAKWPPFPFSSLGHDCAVSLPEEAQGGWPPFEAFSVPGWCPQALRRQDWTEPNGKVGDSWMCVCLWGDGGCDRACLPGVDTTRSGCGGPTCVRCPHFHPSSFLFLSGL